MSRLRRLLRLRGRGREDVERAVDEEMRLHIELRAEELRGEGMDAAAALAEARRRFAHGEQTVRELYSTARERDRRMRMRERCESWVQDARYATHGLLRDPVLSGFVVVTLALGIGANVTAFSMVDRLLVRPPAHVADADRLVRVYGTAELNAGEQTSWWVPYPVFASLREHMRTFESVGATRVATGLVGAAQDARRMRIGQVAGAYFQTLGTHPHVGRLFAADEDAAVAGELLVLSEALWRTEFGADPDVVGRTLHVRDVPHTIVGVAPAGFTGTTPRRVDLWVLASSQSARFNNWNITARLAPGATVEEASLEAAAVHRRTAQDAPEWFRAATLSTAPIRFDTDRRRSPEAAMSRWLAAVSLIILLIAFANVVNLLLVRLVRRRRELAIRLALGSGRLRVLRLLALEGGLLAVAAGVASVFVTRVTEPIVQRALFADEGGWSFSLLDARVLSVLLVFVLVSALIVGVVPALQLGDTRLAATLRGSGQPGGGSSRLRSALTVMQAALAVLLLVGAGLFVRSMSNALSVDLGVDADRVITATANLAAPRGADADDRLGYERRIHRTLLDAVESVPGVESAGIAVGRPLDGGAFSATVYLPSGDSVPTLPSRGPYVSSVYGDYFGAVGTPLLRGRTFTPADRADSERVIIVGERMARTLWPDGDPLGECVHILSPSSPCTRVVGIVADVHRSGLHAENSLQYYLPIDQQRMFGGAMLMIRPAAEGAVSWPALRSVIAEASPAVRSVEVALLADALEGEIHPLRLGMVTFGLSGGLALLVAVLGLYSVMSYMVAWRTRELGVRVALGATDRQITRLVVGGGTGLAAIGIAIGVVLAAVAGRWLQPYLFETSAFDPLVVAGVAALLLLVAFAAGMVPARRAARISPTEALRAE